MTSPSVTLLRDKIRYGSEPDNAALIGFWLSSDTPESNERKELQAHYEQQFELLLNTVMDELVPRHWRVQCLDNIYRPLMSFNRIARCKGSQCKLKAMFRELAISCKYTENSLYQ